MTAHVQRHGSDRISVEDPDGHRLDLIAKGRELEFRGVQPFPHLSPEIAHTLADELHQWAYARQTRRARR